MKLSLGIDVKELFQIYEYSWHCYHFWSNITLIIQILPSSWGWNTVELLGRVLQKNRIHKDFFFSLWNCSKLKNWEALKFEYTVNTSKIKLRTTFFWEFNIIPHKRKVNIVCRVCLCSLQIWSKADSFDYLKWRLVHIQ